MSDGWNRTGTEKAEKYRLSGSVMTHPKRLAAARRLAAGAPPGALSVVVDPEPTGIPSVLRTALAAWSAIESGATHHLILQDDMLLSDTFFERAQRAMELMPDAALSLFAVWDSRNGAAMRFGALAGARWVAAVNEYTPCPALILPREVAAGFVAYARPQLYTWPDDILMYRFLRAEKVRCFVSVPNLAEHDDPPSLSGNAFRGPRRSACFLPSDPVGEESTALGGLSVVPFYKHGTAQCAVRVQDSDPPRWLHLTCEQYLDGLGVSVERLRAGLRAPAGVDPGAAWATWLTGYTMGLVAGRGGHDQASGSPSGSRQPSARAVEEAMGTVGPGGLSQHHGQQEIDRCKEAFAGLARAGLAAGTQDAGAGAPRRPARRGTVAVVAGNSLLGEYVVRGLADRGHQVTVVDARPLDGRHPGVRRIPADLADAQDLARALSSAGAGAVVDLTGVPSDGGAGHADPVAVRKAVQENGVPLLVRFTGTAPADPPQPGECVLRVGEVYGPGASRNSVIGRMVGAALISRPVAIEADPRTTIRPLHVADLTGALAHLLDLARQRPGLGNCRETPRADPTGVSRQFLMPVLTPGRPLTLREVAATVVQAVRPVPVQPPPAAEPPLRPASPELPGADVPGWRPAVPLAHGLHTFAQWLAYEAPQPEIRSAGLPARWTIQTPGSQ